MTGEVHLQDGGAIAKAERGDLTEISCGYQCDLDPTPGVHLGQPYDAVQRNIRINHVALGPKGWGRMGPETRMRLDAREGVSGEDEAGSYVRDDHGDTPAERSSMTDEEKAALKKAQDDAVKANADLEKARQDAKDAKTEGEKLAAQARADAAEIAKLKAENEAYRLQSERQKQDGHEAVAAANSNAATEKLVEEMIQLRADARMVFATAEDPDGKAWKSDGKSPDDIRLEIITFLEPKLRLDGVKGIADKGARAAALSSTYEIVISHKRSTDQARADAAKSASGERRGEGGDDDEAPFGGDAGKARKDMVARKKDGWKPKAKS